jgi:hypothetical protein
MSVSDAKRLSRSRRVSIRRIPGVTPIAGCDQAATLSAAGSQFQGNSWSRRDAAWLPILWSTSAAY